MEKNSESLSDEFPDEPFKNLKGYNPDLGTPKDPRFASYIEFLKQIDTTEAQVFKFS